MKYGEQYDDPARLAELLRAAADGRAYLPTSANVGDELRAAAHWYERKAEVDAEQHGFKPFDATVPKALLGSKNGSADRYGSGFNGSGL